MVNIFMKNSDCSFRFPYLKWEGAAGFPNLSRAKTQQTSSISNQQRSHGDLNVVNVMFTNHVDCAPTKSFYIKIEA